MQRCIMEEKATIKGGGTPDWPRKKAAHKDTDARWTLKRGRIKKGPGGDASERIAHGLLIPAFGYKSHINVDRHHKLIRTWTVTHGEEGRGRKAA